MQLAMLVCVWGGGAHAAARSRLTSKLWAAALLACPYTPGRLSPSAPVTAFGWVFCPPLSLPLSHPFLPARSVHSPFDRLLICLTPPSALPSPSLLHL